MASTNVKFCVLLVQNPKKVCLVESYTRRGTADYFGSPRGFKKIWFTATDWIAMVVLMSTMKKTMPQMYK